MKARLRKTNGDLQEVTLVPNYFGLGKNGVRFKSGIVHQESDCITDKKVDRNRCVCRTCGEVFPHASYRRVHIWKTGH